MGYYKQHGFKRGIYESNIYIKTLAENQFIVVVYVDDIIF